jgi:hypothetical protein
MRTIASPAIAHAVLIAKILVTCLHPISMKGILITTIRSDNGIPVRLLVSSEISVTPRSMKLLGSRKPFRPNPADKTPRVIRIRSLANRFLFLLISSISFSIVY